MVDIENLLAFWEAQTVARTLKSGIDVTPSPNAFTYYSRIINDVSYIDIMRLS